jgi:hypothetical protein
MKVKCAKVHNREILKHETKKHILIKFLLVSLIFLGYFGFIAFEYGLKDGLLVTALTWSFFVLCTPVADAGFLLDFPFRLITRIRMFFSEIFVWLIAISLSSYAFFVHPEIYEKTKLLLLFKHILEQPIPFWSIIAVSAIGTFMSIQFGDELIDKVKHKERELYKKHKHRFKFWAMIFIVILSVILYDFLLKQLGVELPI